MLANLPPCGTGISRLPVAAEAAPAETGVAAPSGSRVEGRTGGTSILTAFLVPDKAMAALGHRDQALRAGRRRGSPDGGGVVLPEPSGAVPLRAAERVAPQPPPAPDGRPAGTGAGDAGGAVRHGEAHPIGHMPTPPCGGDGHGRNVRGKDFRGYRAAGRERSYGRRLKPISTTVRFPVLFGLVPGGMRDLVPLHEPACGLPAGAAVYGDKVGNAGDDAASLANDTAVRLVPIRKANVRPNARAAVLAPGARREHIEALHSPLDAPARGARAPTPASKSSSTPRSSPSAEPAPINDQGGRSVAHRRPSSVPQVRSIPLRGGGSPAR